MHILIANEDGLAAPGLWTLASRLAHLGRISIATPIDDQAGGSRRLGRGGSAAVESIDVDLAGRGVARVFPVQSAPASCALVSVGPLLASPPDVVVSGIHLGLSVGTAIWSSGVVRAARVACLLGRPALAVSLDHQHGVADAEPAWATAADLAASIVHALVRERWPAVVLNLNVPNRPPHRLAGLAATVPSAACGMTASAEPGSGSDGVRVGRPDAAEAEIGTDAWAVCAGLPSLSLLPPLPAGDHSADLAALCSSIARQQRLARPPARRRLVVLPGGRGRR